MGQESHIVELISNNGVAFGLHQIQTRLGFEITSG